MHLHAEHSLFFERRQPLWVAALAVALTSSVLIVNAGARSTVLSLTCSGLGAVLLLFAHAHGRRRIKPALAWTLGVVALALLAGVALNSDTDVIVQTSARVLCGAIWILWLGTQIDWASLRQLLLRIRIPEGIVASLDHALMHGVLAQREWVQRRDAGRLRLGSPRLPAAAWGPLLGEGALHAFTRLERAEENGLLRSASWEDVQAHDGVHLDAIDVKRGGHLVLRQLELRLARAEWLLVLGPSGAGKSSLLRPARGARRTHARDHDAPGKPRVARYDAPRPAPRTRGPSRPEPGTPLHRKHGCRGHCLGPASPWRRARRGATSIPRGGDGPAHRSSAAASVSSTQLRGAAPRCTGRSPGARARVAPPRRAHGRARPPSRPLSCARSLQRLFAERTLPASGQPTAFTHCHPRRRAPSCCATGASSSMGLQKKGCRNHGSSGAGLAV